MKYQRYIRLGLIAVALIVAYFQKDKLGGSGEGGNTNSKSAIPQLILKDTEIGKAGSQHIIKNAVIRDMDGSVAYQGNVDLGPTLDRIKAGKSHSHKNDGSVFGNYEKRLPNRERGYYREYVVPTPGIRHAGPQRLVIGKGGEVYYTGDHYKSFTKIQG